MRSKSFVSSPSSALLAVYGRKGRVTSLTVRASGDSVRCQATLFGVVLVIHPVICIDRSVDQLLDFKCSRSSTRASRYIRHLRPRL